MPLITSRIPMATVRLCTITHLMWASGIIMLRDRTTTMADITAVDTVDTIAAAATAAITAAVKR